MPKLTAKPNRRLKLDKSEEEPVVKSRMAPGRTVESRENVLISKAYDLVEKRIDRGTATSQETTHFLKIGSTLAQLEKEKMERENELLKAKAESLTSQKHMEELFEKAMNMFGIYRGEVAQDDEDD